MELGGINPILAFRADVVAGEGRVPVKQRRPPSLPWWRGMGHLNLAFSAWQAPVEVDIFLKAGCGWMQETPVL